jgi:hypothetical protein
MERRWGLLILAVMSSPAQAQDAPLFPSHGATIVPAAPYVEDGPPPSPSGPLTGNHNFPNFINFISNPLQSIDPRAVTAIYPLVLSSWVSTPPGLPDGDVQVYGPALTVALSDRLAVGLNQGGYATSNFVRDQSDRVLRDPRFPRIRDALRDRVAASANGGSHDGWLNLGGFAQYTLIEDVPGQFLLTGGVRLEVPCGSHDAFQGYGPAHMAPYLTAGKELGEFHLLATTGYQFPIGAGDDTSELFYANFHLDRRCFGWLYPQVELNCIYHTHNVDFGLVTRRGFIDLDTFEASGNLVALAAGLNAVLVP